MTTEERRYPDANPDLAYDLAKNHLSILLSTVDNLDNKLTFGISLATALVAVPLTFLGIRSGQAADIIAPWPIGLMISTGCLYLISTGCLYLLSLAFLFSAFWRSAWQIGLPAEKAWGQAEAYKDYPDILYWWATEMLIDSIANNEEQYRQKQGLATAGFVFLGLQFVTGAVTLAVTF